MTSVKQTFVVDTKVEGNTIYITSNIEQAFNMLPFIQFDKENADKILNNANDKIGKISFTESAQRNDLEIALREQKPKNTLVMKMLADEKSHQCILNLILYGKYILDYKKEHKANPGYIKKFKENLLELQKINSVNIATYLEAFCVAEVDTQLLRVIPLAYHEIAAQELKLDNFRASELMGHNIAYEVAESKTKIEKLIIKSPDEKPLETYSVQEINVTKVRPDSVTVRDDILRGCILIPEYSAKIPNEPVIYISWAGTDNMEKLLADLQTAAGEESYRCGEDQIARQMVDTIKKFSEQCKKPVKVIFTGHSLGGALAQLSYHTLQRVLARSIKDPRLQMEVSTLEEKFNDELDRLTSFPLSMHQQSLHGIRLPTECVSGMSVDVWSDADVLKPVEDHSNDLSLLLSTHANISQSANFARVGGDIETQRQGTILSKAGENGAKVRLLTVDSDLTLLKTALMSPATGGVVGSVVFLLAGLSTIPGFLLGASVSSALAIKSKFDAHTKRHFEQDGPQDSYQIYFSHNSEGTLNKDPDTGYKKIQEELCGTTSITDIAIGYFSAVASTPRLRSQRRLHDNRFQSAIRSAEVKDQTVADGRNEHMLDMLVKELKAATIGANDRIFKIATERNLLNVQDRNGKTLLHHAIENSCDELSRKLLTANNLDINIQDSKGESALHYAIKYENYALARVIAKMPNVDLDLRDDQDNTPVLMLMWNINSIFPKNKEAYQLGSQLVAEPVDLYHKNKQGMSVDSIYKSWNWHGTGMTRKFAEDLVRALAENQRPMHNMFSIFNTTSPQSEIQDLYARQKDEADNSERKLSQ